MEQTTISIRDWLGLCGLGVIFNLVTAWGSWSAMIIRAYVAERKQIPKWMHKSVWEGMDSSFMDVPTRLANLNHARSYEIVSVIWGGIGINWGTLSDN